MQAALGTSNLQSGINPYQETVRREAPALQLREHKRLQIEGCR